MKICGRRFLKAFLAVTTFSAMTPTVVFAAEKITGIAEIRLGMSLDELRNVRDLEDIEGRSDHYDTGIIYTNRGKFESSIQVVDGFVDQIYLYTTTYGNSVEKCNWYVESLEAQINQKYKPTKIKHEALKDSYGEGVSMHFIDGFGTTLIVRSEYSDRDNSGQKLCHAFISYHGLDNEQYVF